MKNKSSIFPSVPPQLQKLAYVVHDKIHNISWARKETEGKKVELKLTKDFVFFLNTRILQQMIKNKKKIIIAMGMTK
jgi:hypothetical protein